MSRETDRRLDAIFAELPDPFAGEPEPRPGTLHGMAGIARPDVLWWAPDFAGFCALREAGFPQTVMLAPDGRRDIFEPLRDHEAALAECGKFVLCGGSEDFTAELARRLGRHRVWQVRFPDGCADAADTLREQGEDSLREAVNAAEAYPLEGVHRTTAAEMIAYLRRPPPAVLTTGAEATDEILRLPSEGKLIVVTGIPSNGKSSWLVHVMAHTAMEHGRRWAVFSPEMGEWRDFAARIIGCLAGTPARLLTDAQIATWAEWMRPRFAFISRDSEDEAPTLDWLLETFRACVLREGVTDALCDPWNQIAHQRDGMSETDYTDMSLRRMSAFGRRHGCNMWIVAHPTKLRPAKPGEPPPVPTAYDISGSAGWYNKADLIACIHRKDGITQLHLQKARFARWAPQGAGDTTRQTFAELVYSRETGRYTSRIARADDGFDDSGELSRFRD